MILAATQAKLDTLTNPDPWLKAMALSLAKLMDEEPASAVAKELRAVMELLTVDKTPITTLETLLSPTALGNPTH